MMSGKIKSPKFQILVFLLLTLAGSIPFYWMIIKVGSIQKHVLLPLCLMWMPGLMGLLCSRIFGHGFRDIGFRKGNLKAYLAAYFIPIGVAAFIFLGLLIFNLGEFQINPNIIEKKGSVGNAVFHILVLGPLIGSVGIVAALGEEMGWRGFLYTQMHNLNFKYPDYIIGFIWSLWHWPLILLGDYATSPIPILSAVMFTIALTAMGPYYGWLRGSSKSVFPVALSHASHNLYIQAIYPAFIKAGPLDSYFGGEPGVFCVIAYVFIGIFFHKRNQSLRGI